MSKTKRKTKTLEQRFNEILVLVNKVNELRTGPSEHAKAVRLQALANALTRASRMVPKKTSFKLPKNTEGYYAGWPTIMAYEWQDFLQIKLNRKNIHELAARCRRLARIAHQIAARSSLEMKLFIWHTHALRMGDDLWVNYKHPLGVDTTVKVSIDGNDLPVTEDHSKPDMTEMRYRLPKRLDPYNIHVFAQAKVGKYVSEKTDATDFDWPVEPVKPAVGIHA